MPQMLAEVHCFGNIALHWAYFRRSGCNRQQSCPPRHMARQPLPCTSDLPAPLRGWTLHRLLCETFWTGCRDKEVACYTYASAAFLVAGVSGLWFRFLGLEDACNCSYSFILTCLWGLRTWVLPAAKVFLRLVCIQALVCSVGRKREKLLSQSLQGVSSIFCFFCFSGFYLLAFIFKVNFMYK